MTATHGNDPQVHHVIVTRDDDGYPESMRFECTAPPDAPCRRWPDCGCEQWTQELHGTPPAPGHEDVPQNECWLDPWFQTLSPTPGDWLEIYNDLGSEPTIYELRTGPIDVSWEMDYVAWSYATPKEQT